MEQKFIDKDGLKVLWNQISLKDYPNNEILMAVIDAIDKTKANKDEIVQADWNQTDENKLDFIKNKPFGKESNETILVNKTLNYDSYEGGFITSFQQEINPQVGNIYKVSINGEDTQEFILGEDMLYTYNSVDGKNYNLNFGMGWVDVLIRESSGDTNPIDLYIASSVDTYHIIDECYLPPLVGETAEKGFAGEIFNDYENNVASGESSHAEGSSTKASGTYSHTEGKKTEANGTASHAEGANTIASKRYSHAEGNYSHAEGQASHAEGYYAKASGTYSHAEGNKTEASGSASHSEGGSTTASGSYSHSEGYNTIASGNYSHTEGYNTKATITDDTASSTDIGTKGYYAHAEGYGSVAYGAISHAEGNGTKASGNYSHSEGNGTKAKGGNSHAEGYNTTASGDASHAEGYNTTASEYASHAEGHDTTASGSNSHAEGSGTDASGMYSHAEGGNTTASGVCSHAEGGSAIASGSHSHAEGTHTVASSDYSHVEGYYTTASGKYQHVQGKFNIEDTEDKYAHIVGNGTDTVRSNAHTLDWDGNAWYQGTIKLGGTSYNDASEIALKSDVENKKNKDIVLTLSWTTAEDGTRTYSVDKTFEEIKEAYNSGTSLYVNASGIKFECTKVSNTTAWFDYYLPLGMIEHNILVKSDNTVTWTSKTRSAQASICGGVKADKKSDTDTVPAKIGEDGKLYVPTYPTLDGLASEDYVNENIEITKTELDAVKKNVNTFINDPYKILRDLAIISTGGVEITDLSLYETNYGFIGNAGTWVNINEKYQYVMIPITSKGAKLQVTALEDAVFYFAGLRSFDSTPSANDVPDYSTAEGWTGRRTGSMGNTHSYQIPDDVKYLYVNVVYNTKPVYTSDFKLTIPESDGRINILEKKVEALEQGTTLPQEPIKWIALGDSITEGYYSVRDENTEDTENHKDTSKSYCAWIARQKGFELTNKGVGGSGWLKRGTSGAPKLNAREQIDAVNEDGSYVLDFTQFDLCTIMWGVNDWKGGEFLGAFEDGINPETESVISNMRYVIETILTRNPEIKLIILTPVNCRQDTSARPSTAENNWGIGFTFGSGENKKTLQDYYDAIKQVCDYYGVEMIDMLHNSVINRINAETLLPDKVHPSLEAHRKMGLDLAGKILFGN